MDLTSGPPGVYTVFFGWPAGGVWSNLVAWILGLIIGAGCAFLFRDRLGRKIAPWWERHIGHGDLGALHDRFDHLHDRISEVLQRIEAVEQGTAGVVSAPKPPDDRKRPDEQH